jgi:hypothetical protein
MATQNQYFTLDAKKPNASMANARLAFDQNGSFQVNDG